MKAAKSLEKRGILLKETTRKNSHQKGGFLNSLRPLMSVALTLMKNVLTLLVKRVLVPLGFTAAV